jgi:hypothetical protein
MRFTVFFYRRKSLQSAGRRDQARSRDLLDCRVVFRSLAAYFGYPSGTFLRHLPRDFPSGLYALRGPVSIRWCSGIELLAHCVGK